jgi:phage repressor protein C with HTH and peptisase S24 domain
MEFAELIQSRLDELGLNIHEAEQRFGFSEGFIRGVVRDDHKRATPNIEKARRIALALGLDFYIGPRREAGPVRQLILDGAEYAHVPVHEASLSAGPGSANDDSIIIDHLAFRRDWLQRIGVDASQACLARVFGHSMEPTLWAGDMVLIDRTKTEPVIRRRSETDLRPSPIYAFVQGGEARVKRIERPDAKALILISDNSDIGPELYAGTEAEQLQLTIIGKVVWSGHTWR